MHFLCNICDACLRYRIFVWDLQAYVQDSRMLRLRVNPIEGRQFNDNFSVVGCQSRSIWVWLTRKGPTGIIGLFMSVSPFANRFF